MIALTFLGEVIAPRIAQARSFENTTVSCYFFKGETLALKETCKSNGSSWAGGGGHSLKWSDGVVTEIKFGLQGRGTPICADKEQTSVDGQCGNTYYRSAKTLKRVNPTGQGETIYCVQLVNKSVCWGGFSK